MYKSQGISYFMLNFYILCDIILYMKISDFIKKYTIYSEDNPEIDQLVTDAAESEIRTCLFCGKPFVARGRNCTRMKYCTRLHYINCQICGNRYYITKSDIQSNKINETCSDRKSVV